MFINTLFKSVYGGKIVKMISVMDNTYEKLRNIKGEKSFSETINESPTLRDFGRST